jgi:hypothetical protein
MKVWLTAKRAAPCGTSSSHAGAARASALGRTAECLFPHHLLAILQRQFEPAQFDQHSLLTAAGQF